ncbi:unnamed protein product [Lota lota]
MLDLKKSQSVVLKVETEFRRVAVRRRSKGGVEDHVPPEPAHLQTPEKTPGQTPEKTPGQTVLTPRNLKRTSVASLGASQCPTGEGKQTNSQRARVAVLIQVFAAGALTSESPAGTSPGRRSDGTTLLGAPEGQDNPASLSSRDAAHKQAKHSGPSLPTVDPSELAPLMAPPSAHGTTTSPACERKDYTNSATVLSPETRGLSTDPTPCPAVPGPGPAVPGPGPAVPGPGPAVPGPGLRVGAGLELMSPGGGAQGPSGVGGSRPASEKDMMSLEEGRSHEGVDQLTDVENEEDEKESKGKEKRYNVVMELLMTERAYVARLHLLDQVFCSRLAEEASHGSFPLEVVKNLFSNISSIHSFHSQFLLPDLEERMLHWWDRPALGDVLLHHAPFLRMYAEYVGNFEQAMALLRTWRGRSAAFRAVLQDVQSQEVCGRLGLEHHMLEPVQRVPRYEMLLKAYLRNLPEDDPDHPLAEKALEAISMAAGHSNSAIHRAASLKKLLDIFEMVSEEEILKPSTKFLREGRLLKLAARNTSVMERYLFLFNDFLLCCTPRLILVGQRYWVRTRIGVEGMQVQRTAHEEYPHSFQISGKEKTLELEASSEKDRDEWIKVIQEAIDVFHEKNETLKLESDETVPEEELGRRAPRWIRDNEVVECMKCREAFNTFTRRRHHCRACGCVVCWKCSDHKVALEYDKKRLSKVCKDCHGVLSGREPTEPKRHSLQHTVGSLWFARFRRVWSVVLESQPITRKLYATRQESSPMLMIPLRGGRLQEFPQSSRTPGGSAWSTLHSATPSSARACSSASIG